MRCAPATLGVNACLPHYWCKAKLFIYMTGTIEGGFPRSSGGRGGKSAPFPLSSASPPRLGGVWLKPPTRRNAIMIRFFIPSRRDVWWRSSFCLVENSNNDSVWPSRRNKMSPRPDTWKIRSP